MIESAFVVNSRFSSHTQKTHISGIVACVSRNKEQSVKPGTLSFLSGSPSFLSGSNRLARFDLLTEIGSDPAGEQKNGDSRCGSRLLVL